MEAFYNSSVVAPDKTESIYVQNGTFRHVLLQQKSKPRELYQWMKSGALCMRFDARKFSDVLCSMQ